MRAMPAAFQNRDDASSATPTNAPPMAAARAPTPILRNWPSNVPTFSKILAAPATPGIRNPARARTAMVFLTISSFATSRLADDDELAALRTLIGIHGEDVDPAHDVLAIARDEIPPRLAVVRIVLLPIEPRSSVHGIADRLVGRIVRLDLRHQVP